MKVLRGGGELTQFTRNLVVGRKPVDFVLPTALNDAPGTYVLQLEDRYTHKLSSAQFRLAAVDTVLP